MKTSGSFLSSLSSFSCDTLFAAFGDYTGLVLHWNVLSVFGISSIRFPLFFFITVIATLVVTFRTHFINLRDIFTGFRVMFGISKASSSSSVESSAQISPLKALFSVLSGSAGIGNTVSIASMVAICGPGSALWILITPILFYPLRFAEVFLSHKYRVQNDDSSFSGGPSYYMKVGFMELGWPKLGSFLAFIYSFCLLMGSFGGGSVLQSNQIVHMVSHGLPSLVSDKFVISTVFTIVVVCVVIGGLKRITNFLTYVLPFTVIGYMVISIIVIAFNHSNIVPSLKLIFLSTFTVKSAASGIIAGFILSVTRVMMATEIGTGTASVMHSSSSNQDSIKEAFLSTVSPFIGAFCVCFISALLVIVTNTYNTLPMGVVMIYGSVSTVVSWLQYIILAMFLCMSFNVVIAWSIYGSSTAMYLFGNKAKIPYQIMFCVFVFAGGLIEDVGIVLKLTDVLNTSVFIPNAIAISCLSGVTARAYFEYKNKFK